MIEIYNANNTNYEMNGDVTLLPESCVIDAELNGTWEMRLEHPIDEDGRWRYIVEGAVIAAPFLTSKKQLYRIYWKYKGMTGISAKARPIFMDAAGEVFLNDVRPTEKNGQNALNAMTAGQTKYKAISNIAGVSTAYYVRKNLIEAIQSDLDQAFINRWGGEVYYDNYTIYVNERIGFDNGMRVEIGLNCESVEAEIDMSNVTTRIVPTSYNGYGMTSSTPWIDSPLINHYPVVYTKTIEFSEVKMREDVSNSDDDDIIICDTDEQRNEALKKKCQELFETGIDKPMCNYQVNLIDLSKTEEYKELRNLEAVGFGDTVHCKNRELDIETDGRVIKVSYDCIGEKNDSVEIGDFAYNYINDLEAVLNRVDKAINQNGTVKAEKVMGILDGVRAMMRAQATVAQPAPVRATIFEDLNPKSPTYGALCLGTMGFQIAYERTADGREWDWRTFGTGRGFFADYIVAGTMLCDRIRGGTLKLGGLDNIDGLLRLVDAKDVEIGRWDKDGITITRGSIRSSDFVEGESGIEIDLDASTMTSYKTDAFGNRSKCVFSDGGVTITNPDNTGEKISIRFEKNGDNYIPIISGFSGGRGFSMNHNALVYMIDTVFKSSIGVSGDKGYVATDELTVREAVKTGGGQGITKRIDLPGNAFMIFHSGICVGGGSAVDGKTGRAEFSDNSWMHFTGGIIDGGHTTEGGDL